MQNNPQIIQKVEGSVAATEAGFQYLTTFLPVRYWKSNGSGCRTRQAGSKAAWELIKQLASEQSAWR
jgi:hypothetical protein